MESAQSCMKFIAWRCSCSMAMRNHCQHRAKLLNDIIIMACETKIQAAGAPRVSGIALWLAANLMLTWVCCWLHHQIQQLLLVGQTSWPLHVVHQSTATDSNQIWRATPVLPTSVIHMVYQAHYRCRMAIVLLTHRYTYQHRRLAAVYL